MSVVKSKWISDGREKRWSIRIESAEFDVHGKCLKTSFGDPYLCRFVNSMISKLSRNRVAGGGRILVFFCLSCILLSTRLWFCLLSSRWYIAQVKKCTCCGNGLLVFFLAPSSLSSRARWSRSGCRFGLDVQMRMRTFECASFYVHLRLKLLFY